MRRQLQIKVCDDNIIQCPWIKLILIIILWSSFAANQIGIRIQEWINRITIIIVIKVIQTNTHICNKDSDSDKAICDFKYKIIV